MLKDRALKCCCDPGFHLYRCIPAISSFHHTLIISMCLEGTILIEFMPLFLTTQNDSKSPGDIFQWAKENWYQYQTSWKRGESTIQTHQKNIILWYGLEFFINSLISCKTWSLLLSNDMMWLLRNYILREKNNLASTWRPSLFCSHKT